MGVTGALQSKLGLLSLFYQVAGRCFGLRPLYTRNRDRWAPESLGVRGLRR